MSKATLIVKSNTPRPIVDALLICGLGILVAQAKSPKEKAKAQKALDEAMEEWLDQRFNPKCAHCGKPLKQ